METTAEKEKQKIVLMAILLAGSCFLTYYFHAVLGIVVLFTHFFYIPIILASFWWKRKGVAVALFLAVFLIFSHHFLRESITIGDYFRALMFVVISFVVALLSERIAKKDEGLRENEEKYRTLFENAGEAIVVAQDGVLKLANPKGEELYGYSGEELTSKPFIDFIHEGDREMVGERHRRRLRGELPPDAYPARIINKAGETKWVEVDLVSFSWEDRPAALCFLKDITERKQAEEELRDSEARYRNIFENTGTATMIIEEDMTISMASAEFEKLSGYSKKEIENRMTWPQFVDKEELERMKEYHVKRRENERSVPTEYEFRFIDRDGNIRDIFLKIGIIPGTKRSICSLMDITSKKQAERTLRESEKRYRTILETIQEAYFEVDIAGNFTFFNDSLSKILGYSNHELAGMNNRYYMSPESSKKIYDLFNQIYNTGNPIKKVVYEIIRKDGGHGFHELSASLVKDQTGRPIGFRGIAHDITDLKKAGDALRESEEKYRTILENIEEAYFEVDLAGNFTFFNDAMCKIRGCSRDELMGMNNREYMDPETAKKVYKAYNKVYTTGKPAKNLEWETIRRDGTKSHVETSASIIKDSEGEPIGFRGVVRDVTERKRAEQEKGLLQAKLHQAQKMESLGLMAGGVAHDLNNILAGIVAYPDLLLLELPEDSPLRETIKAMKESGLRAADVVADLLTITRGVATGKEALNLNGLIEEYLASAEQMKLETVRPSVTFKPELDTDLLNIRGSSTHIKKTVMNLVTNASEAIEGLGTVTISTRSRYLDEPLKGYEDVRIGEYALLTVSDDGSGISPEDLHRIFEPFYTKKVMGRSGTGLGLTVVWNTVRDHDGYIDIKSSKRGTVFDLYFPVTREEVAAEKGEVPLEDYLGHGEKILVVDDEERQREIACGLLTRLGYIAEAVSSGEEAIEYVKEQPVDLIVLDMVMPRGITGLQTYEEIVKIHPKQKAIIASGFAKTREVETAQKLGAGEYIKKPFTLEKIGLSVKEELGY